MFVSAAEGILCGFFIMSELPILPHLLRQMLNRIDDYSGKTFSLYLRQPRQSINLLIYQKLSFVRRHLSPQMR